VGPIVHRRHYDPGDFVKWPSGILDQELDQAFQEAYLRAFRFFPSFRGGDARAWLMKIVRNTCYTWLHANRPLQDATEFDENFSPPDSRAPNPQELVLQNDNDTQIETLT
jgi:RNA polymerase sigma-70 factor, ECF subfamily